MKEKTIALLGQPNAGKSTLFNGLTSSRQHVGNWPGKTVERKEDQGSLYHGAELASKGRGAFDVCGCLSYGASDFLRRDAMLGELLHLLKDGNSHNVQELADLLHEGAEGIPQKLEYLEQRGYLRKVSLAGKCNYHCIGCHGCDQVNPRLMMWEVVNR